VRHPGVLYRTDPNCWSRQAEGKLTPMRSAPSPPTERTSNFQNLVVMTITQRRRRSVYSSTNCAAIPRPAANSVSTSTWEGAAFATRSALVQPGRQTWRAGIRCSMLCGTTNGMAAGEAFCFFNPRPRRISDYRCKQAGQLASNAFCCALGRMLATGEWLRNAEHGNACDQPCAEINGFRESTSCFR